MRILRAEATRQQDLKMANRLIQKDKPLKEFGFNTGLGNIVSWFFGRGVIFDFCRNHEILTVAEQGLEKKKNDKEILQIHRPQSQPYIQHSVPPKVVTPSL